MKYVARERLRAGRRSKNRDGLLAVIDRVVGRWTAGVEDEDAEGAGGGDGGRSSGGDEGSVGEDRDDGDVRGELNRSASRALGTVSTAEAVDGVAQGAHEASEDKVASKISTAALHSLCWGAREVEVMPRAVVDAGADGGGGEDEDEENGDGGVAIALSMELRGWEAVGMVAVIDRVVGQ